MKPLLSIRLSLVLLFLVLVQADNLAAQQGATQTAAQSGITDDRYCGPRSVRCVLKHYSIQSDLHELIAEIMGSNRVAGSTVGQLENALVKRGLYCKVVVLTERFVPDWDEPVLVHLLPTSSASIGHYGVLLPPRRNDGLQSLWMGPKQIDVIGDDALSHRMSGVALFVSHKPILEEAKLSRRVGLEPTATWLGLALVFAALVYILFQIVWAVLASRRKPAPKDLEAVP